MSLPDFERFCSLLKTESGAQLKVLPHERKILRDYFRGAEETVAIVPKKNGKTTLLAALALFHAKNVPSAEVPIAARSRDQAGVMYRQAVGLLRRSGKQAGKNAYVVDGATYSVKAGYREIWCDESRIRVMAADADTADGIIPTLALVDELHRASSSDLYGVFRDGLVARNGQMVTISTAGWDMKSPLGVIRARAHALPSFKRRGKYNYAKAGGFAFHEWCLDDGDDVHDMRVVKRANPAPWQTPDKLRRMHDSPSTRTAQWTRFACGVWTHGEEPWLQAAEWDRMRVDLRGIEPGESVVGAMIYGHGAAVVLAAQREEGIAVLSFITDEDVALSAVERIVLDLSEQYDITKMAHNTLARSAEFLLEHGVPMDDFPMSPVRLQAATVTLRRMIDDGVVYHTGDPQLRQHVLAGATTDSERGWRLMRTPETQGLIALAVAAHLASQGDVAPMFYSLENV